jgi:hypothetical protein
MEFDAGQDEGAAQDQPFENNETREERGERVGQSEPEGRGDRNRGRRDRWGRGRRNRNRSERKGSNAAPDQGDAAPAQNVAEVRDERSEVHREEAPAPKPVERPKPEPVAAAPAEAYQPPKWQPPAPTVENRPAQAKTGWWSKRG